MIYAIIQTILECVGAKVRTTDSSAGKEVFSLSSFGFLQVVCILEKRSFLMGYYDDVANVEQYLKMAEGYDGRFLVERLKGYLPPKSSVLELGMGPGKDLDLLDKTYTVTGSDNSKVFVERYLKKHPHADILLLDAVTLKTDRTFDCIYSNKVMHHVRQDQMKVSFRRQYELLHAKGLALHSFWYGHEIEDYDGMMVYQVTETDLERILDGKFEILELERYTEMEENDSLYGIFRKLP
jgi:SAM-dependent methyltransferase